MTEAFLHTYIFMTRQKIICCYFAVWEYCVIRKVELLGYENCKLLVDHMDLNITLLMTEGKLKATLL